MEQLSHPLLMLLNGLCDSNAVICLAALDAKQIMPRPFRLLCTGSCAPRGNTQNAFKHLDLEHSQ